MAGARSIGRRGRRLSTALAGATVVAAGLGLVLSRTHWGEQHLASVGDVRVLAVVAAGLLLAGAGLMELASWRVDVLPHHLRRGLALVVLGLTGTVLTGLGPLVHDSTLVAALNPVTTSVAGVATVVLLATSAARRDAEPLLHVPQVLLGCAVVVAGLVALRATTGVTVDQAPTARLAIELAITAAWLCTAWRAHRAGHGPAETALWAWFAVLWGMRAAAVTNPEWGVASGLLVVAIALVVVAAASWELVAATEAGHDRIDDAEAALAAAHGLIMHHEQQRRDVCHDARNAMLALRMSTYTLSRHGEVLDPEMRERLGATVVRQVEHLERLLGERPRGRTRREVVS